MLEIFSDNTYKTYKTERFCNLANKNIMLLVETCNDGSEKKICQDFDICKSKDKCRYLFRSNTAQHENFMKEVKS
ncbi:MAG: hypothetical protein FWD71_22080 [Oscillospiraceae bacterium]|nr:hypothetical protein [Oscillospiraceae bacterium]